MRPRGRRETAEERRAAMRQRRQDMSIRIRKQRKEERLWQRRTATVGDNAEDGSAVLNALEQFFREPSGSNLITLSASVSNNINQATLIFRNLIENGDETRKAYGLLGLLLQNLQSTDAEVCQASMTILLNISLIRKQTTAADGYYGQTPLCWSDLIADTPSLIATLMQHVYHSSECEDACTIIGNTVQENHAVLKDLVKSWSTIVTRLPHSAYLCAAIVKEDVGTLGVRLLEPLTTSQIAYLLPRKPTEFAWILAGLSRREDAVVDKLCADAKMTNALINEIERATREADTLFLVPALQAVSFMITACSGIHSAIFISSQAFVTTLNYLLDTGTVLDAILVAGYLMAETGTPDHLATTIAAPNFLPRLTKILVSDIARWEWKRDACSAIYDALTEPPAKNGKKQQWQHNSSNTSTLSELLINLVWSGNEEKIMQSLVDLLKVPDTDTTLIALLMTDLLLRNIPNSSPVFEHYHGVDQLDRIWQSGDDRDEEDEDDDHDMISFLVSNLLDDFFENDEDYDTESDQDDIAPMVGENQQFVFGIHQGQGGPPASFAFDSSSSAPAGRGRGRTVPAWMQNDSSSTT